MFLTAATARATAATTPATALPGASSLTPADSRSAPSTGSKLDPPRATGPAHRWPAEVGCTWMLEHPAIGRLEIAQRGRKKRPVHGPQYVQYCGYRLYCVPNVRSCQP